MGDLQLLWETYVSSRSEDRSALDRGCSGEAAPMPAHAAPGPAAIRRQLIEAYAPLARYVVERMNIKASSALGYDDLLSQALVGLIDAVDRFDPARGIKFETYAYHRIRGAVMDMLRSLDWLPRSLRQRETDLAAAYSRLQESLGRPPSDEELAGALGVSLDELNSTARDLALQSTQSLDEAISHYSTGSHSGSSGASYPAWESATLADAVPDHDAVSPQEHLERQAERDLLARAIEALPEAERTVVSLYYYEGLTLKEVGAVLGVTESRACQIHGKALLRLRAHVQPQLALPSERV